MCARIQVEKVVCPSNLCGGLFVVAALDNCDHNPSSTTSHDSFHSTSISLFQFPANDFSGIEIEKTIIENKSSKKVVQVIPLIECYCEVPSCSFHQTT